MGRGGSGTIFLGGCNLECVYCQNRDISARPVGREVTADELARTMLDLEERGCENVNLVSPTHFAPSIVEAVAVARGSGLDVPVVYNTGTYDTVETVRMLEGTVDIYLADAKYADPEVAARFSGAPDYPDVMRAALRGMHRQVGDLALGERGVARRGLMIRHLVLPEGLAGTAELMRFIADELSPDTYVNVMAQYRPAGDAAAFEEIARPVTRREVEDAIEAARRAGLSRFAG